MKELRQKLEKRRAQDAERRARPMSSMGPASQLSDSEWKLQVLDALEKEGFVLKEADKCDDEAFDSDGFPLAVRFYPIDARCRDQLQPAAYARVLIADYYRVSPIRRGD